MQQWHNVAAPSSPERQSEPPHRPTAEAEEAWPVAIGFAQAEWQRLVFLRWLYRQGHWTDGV